MSLRDEPHYTIASSELASWLEMQGTDRWWSVDGDPLLTGRLSLPCPAAPAGRAPEISPVFALMDRPEGKPVAL
jgi:hypothetical protein